MKPKTRSKTPYQMKGVDVLLGTDAPTDSDAASLIPLDQIVLPKQQPRRYFDTRAMQDLVDSVKQHGILQPLLVRPLDDDKYELVAGERRYRAAQEASLTEIPVVIRDLSPEAALQLALLENLQREDLNPIEETEGIIALLALKLNQSRDAIISLLQTAAHPERASVDNVIHSEEWQVVLEAFNSVGRFTPESFRTNRLPLLNLPEDVQAALREGQIEYTKARAIAKIKDNQQRDALLTAAISENLSLTQIKERIAAITAKNTSESEPATPTLKSRMDTAYAKVKKSKVWDDPKKQKRLLKLVAELESLIADNQ